MFDYADFYPPEQTLTVTTDTGQTLTVSRHGDSHLCRDTAPTHAGSCVRTPEQFRAAFPTGNLPEDGQDGWVWHQNAWFEPATDSPTGWDGDVWHTLSEVGHVTVCPGCGEVATELVGGQGPDGDAEWCWACVHDGRASVTT